MKKSVIIYGEKASGKSTFINNLIPKLSINQIIVNVDQIDDIKRFLSYDVVVIEGCSSIEQIVSINHKIIYARLNRNCIYFILTGSLDGATPETLSDFYLLEMKRHEKTEENTKVGQESNLAPGVMGHLSCPHCKRFF